MPKKGHTEEQILSALHEGESGTKVADILPADGNQPGDVFSVEEKVRWAWTERAAGLSQLRDEKREARAKKVIKPRQRRT